MTFEEKLHAYRGAKLELDRLDHETSYEKKGEQYDSRLDQLVSAQTAATDGLLLTPAKTQRELYLKLKVTAESEAHDNWHLSTPIMALLVEDARRLLMKGGS